MSYQRFMGLKERLTRWASRTPWISPLFASHGVCARNKAESLLLGLPNAIVVDNALLGWKGPFAVEISSDLHNVGPGQLSILEYGIIQKILGHLLLVPTLAHDHKAMGGADHPAGRRGIFELPGWHGRMARQTRIALRSGGGRETLAFSAPNSLCSVSALLVTEHAAEHANRGLVAGT